MLSYSKANLAFAPITCNLSNCYENGGGKPCNKNGTNYNLLLINPQSKSVAFMRSSATVLHLLHPATQLMVKIINLIETRDKLPRLISWPPVSNDKNSHPGDKHRYYKPVDNNAALKKQRPVAAAEREFINPAMYIMITNFVVAVHFGVGGVVIQQARITGFGPVGLQSHSSFLRRHGGSSFKYKLSGNW
jgi:hypothetical protein